MQAVILAAGLGTRMRPLTDSTPKPLLKVCDMPILEHIVSALPEDVSEVLFVIGYRGDLIKAHFGEELRDGRTFQYVEQKELNGTYHALLQVRHLLKGKFLLMVADDIHGKAALAEAVGKDLALIVSRSESPEKFGVVTIDEDNRMLGIIEKPEVPESDLVSTGAMVLDERIFEYENGETLPDAFLPTALTRLAADAVVTAVVQSEWIPIGYPEDLAAAEQILDAREHKPVEGEGNA